MESYEAMRLRHRREMHATIVGGLAGVVLGPLLYWLIAVTTSLPYELQVILSIVIGAGGVLGCAAIARRISARKHARR